MERFKTGLIFEAHRLLYHSTRGLRVIKKKKVGYMGGRSRSKQSSSSSAITKLPAKRWISKSAVQPEKMSAFSVSSGRRAPREIPAKMSVGYIPVYPHGGVQPFQQKSTSITKLTRGLYAVQI